MGAITLLVMAGINVITAVFLFCTGVKVARRPLSHEMRWAGAGFILSWFMLGIMVATDAARLIVAWTPNPNVDLYASLAILKIFATAAMIAGFGYYVGFLITGRRSLAPPILLFAFSHAILFLYIIQYRNPLAIIDGTWGAVMIFEVPPLMIAGSNLVTYTYYFAPPILLALAFLTLLLRFDDSAMRLRALATGLVVIAYHATGFILFAPTMDLNHIANPIAMLLVTAVAIFAWRTQRAPASRTAPSPTTPTTLTRN